MHISIWQQWAGNHSGFFFIIGTFANASEAQRAQNELRNILIRIDRWQRENPEELVKACLSGGTKPVPPETEIAREYSVDWPERIDWLVRYFTAEAEAKAVFVREEANTYHDPHIEEAITLVGNVLYMSNPDQTWMGVEPFASLVRRLGAKNLFGIDLNMLESDGDIKYPGIRLTCTAANRSVADNIYNGFKAHFADPLVVLPGLSAGKIQQDDVRLALEFDICTEGELADLFASLEDMGCTDLVCDLIERGETS